MPRKKTTGSRPAAATTGQKPQHFIVKRLKQDKVAPLISNDISNRLLFDQEAALVNGYAEHIQYPFASPHRLSQMAQFRAIMHREQIPDPLELRNDYIDFIKNKLFDIVEAQATASVRDVLDDLEAEFDDTTFSDFAKRLGYPRHNDPQKNPLQILASFPLSIYLTTSYHGFLEMALKQAGKNPHTEICRWREGLKDIPSQLEETDYRPSPQSPLVYHLCGLDAYPESLVLTDDDYLDLLVAISQDDGRSGIDLIHPRLRRAIADSSLMLLGYSLRRWDFRVLFRSLIKPSSIRQKGIFIQLAPDEIEQEYWGKYLQYEAEFEVQWLDIQSYLAELGQGLED